MIDGVTFFAEVNCQNPESLLDLFQELVPSIADAVDIEKTGYRVRFACGDVKLRFSGDLLSISVEAENLMMCRGIKAILGVIFLAHFARSLPIVWERER
ncbi:hypothetical protein C8J34_11628 [Rhizobium sp. PP-F2F-G36]|nr:hypothetical protein C8J34_11628 [Rhizobium sp. PP-F2F-G36]